MTDAERAAHLEVRLKETQQAAVRMMVALLAGSASGPAGLHAIAAGLEEDAQGEESETERLAGMVAAVLRRA